jgi:anti-anti-sigma regulatory factor
MRKKKTATKGQEAQAPADIQVIHAVRDGEWLAGAEFLAAAVRLADEQVSIQVDLEGMDYLDASSLQILLAIRAGQKAKNRGLSLTRVSTALRQWFRYAGAEQEFTFD